MCSRLAKVVVLFSILGIAGVDAEPLSPKEMEEAVQLDALSIPRPNELFAAIEKQGKPKWSAYYREPISTTYSSRAQIALNLGGLIADGLIAVEAQDGQQVKNIGKDIISLAKSLGVSQNIIGRGSSITDFAENNEWGALKEEMEATENEVKLAMEEMRDHGLVILVSLGGWIRGTEVVSASVARDYTEGHARLLRQPAVVSFMRSRLSELPPRLQEDPLVQTLSEQLIEIEKMVSFPLDKEPAQEDVQKLNAAAARLVSEISTKPN